MSGSPDFTFTLDNVTAKITKGNDDMMGLYMASTTKFALENREAAADGKVMKLNAVKTLLAYCENEHNNMEMTKALKKLSEANKKGELESAL